LSVARFINVSVRQMLRGHVHLAKSAPSPEIQKARHFTCACSQNALLGKQPLHIAMICAP
jgi:hypothetical protein